MPVCRKCGSSHFNFQPCAPEHRRVKRVEVQYREDLPEGFSVSKWGAPKSAPIIYQMPLRPRLGSLIGEDGKPYTPES